MYCPTDLVFNFRKPSSIIFISGHILDFFRQQYQNFKLSLLNLPDGFAEKGVLEEEVLPGYYYR